MISLTYMNLLYWLLFHAIYISVIEVEHSAQDTKADLRIKVFSNDMADALRNAYGVKGDYQETEFFLKNQEYISSYFSHHVIIEINGETVKLNLEKIEKENDTHWFYLSFHCPPGWKKVYIRADMLMEIFPAQSNMVKLTNNGDKQFFRLMKGHSSVEIE